jgi:hypothetical protein
LTQYYSFDETESKNVVFYLHEPNDEPSLAFRSLSAEPILEKDFVFMASSGEFKGIEPDGALPNVWFITKSNNTKV